MWSDLWQKILVFLGRTSAEWKTVGPSPIDHPVPTAADMLAHTEVRKVEGPWMDGWWKVARMCKAHAGRVGLPIVPRAVVAHITDTYPGGFAAIVKSWTTKAGAGNAAHFLIGRSEVDGVVQFVPVTRNSNHAGGKTHGWWKDKAGKLLHPNAHSVGIELDCCGRLKQYDDGAFYHPTTGKEIPISDVYFDSRGKPWHKPTPYQRLMLEELVRDLRLVTKPMPEDWVIVPNGTYAGVAHFASAAHRDLVGHVTLDPANRSDPGPLPMQWLKEIQ